MSENLHDIDDLFKRALNDEEEEPSLNVWENIDRKLDKKSVININRKYRRVKWIAAASIMMVCALGMYTFYTRKVNKELVNKNRTKINEANKKTKTPYYTPDTSSPSVAVESLNKPKVEVSKPVLLKPQIEKEVVKENTKASYTSTAAAIKKSDRKNRFANTVRTQNNLAANTTNKNISPKENVIDKNLAVAPERIISATEKKIIENKKVISGDQFSSKTFTKNIAESNSITNTTHFFLQDFHGSLASNPKANIAEPGLIEFGSKVKNITLLNNQHSTDLKNNIGKIRTPKTKNSVFSTTFYFSPDFVKSHVKNDRQSFREDDKNEIKRHEKTKTSSSMGVLFDYNFSKKWSIESGLTYFIRATNIEAKTIYARPNARGEVKYRFNCSVGYSYIDFKSAPNAPASGDSIKAQHSESTLQYIGIPLAIKYNIDLGRLSLSPTAGMSANILTKGQIETSITSATGNEKARITDIQGLKPSYVSGILSFTAAYKLNQTLALSFSPITRFALTSINKNAPVKTYLNSTGFAAGLMVKF